MNKQLLELNMCRFRSTGPFFHNPTLSKIKMWGTTNMLFIRKGGFVSLLWTLNRIY